MATGAARTGDVGIEHVILLDYIVDELAAVFVHNQDLPLRRSLGQRDQTGGREGVRRTSPRVVLLMVLRMTVESVSWSWSCRLGQTRKEGEHGAYPLAGCQ